MTKQQERFLELVGRIEKNYTENELLCALIDEVQFIENDLNDVAAEETYSLIIKSCGSKTITEIFIAWKQSFEEEEG